MADLSAVDRVSVDELYNLDATALDLLQSRTHHVQHVAVGEKSAREVETDSQRLFLWRLCELNDGSLHLSFTDAEHSHPVDRRNDVVVLSASQQTIPMSPPYTVGSAAIRPSVRLSVPSPSSKRCIIGQWLL